MSKEEIIQKLKLLVSEKHTSRSFTYDGDYDNGYENGFDFGIEVMKDELQQLIKDIEKL